MWSIIKKVRNKFTNHKLKKHLKKLERMKGDIQWSMQFDNLSKSEIDKNNRILNAIEIDKRITLGQINFN
jgi:hypothetical protein